MICATVRSGTECVFMKEKGCSFNGGECYPIVEACQGCAHVLELPTGKFCDAYGNPAVKWVLGRCNYATHVNNGHQNNGSTKKLNPLKASKRSARG
ncbi:MAG: hypothetical protein HYY65_13825 [Candidatus Tectomicrobia bacterium]|uniref:Uncharacterized protein n=1 Tax=Tectimicrobiota bacterium TaxID=2528274 RepID=A0A932M227_UNCTE|nr:hypothetical protein [Candidatus Tectomicrobia bacterium]